MTPATPWPWARLRISSLALLVSAAACVDVDTGASHEPAPPPNAQVDDVQPADAERTKAEAREPTNDPARSFPRQRGTVRADDGHELVVWSKVPAAPEHTILLIHGRTWSSIPDFDVQVDGESVSLMDDLAAAGVAAYAIDLRGYGDTARDETGWITPDRAVADVASVLGWIGERHPELGAPHLFGWSNGSMVAQLTAQRHGDAVSSVVLYGYPTGPNRKYGDPKSTKPPRVRTTAEGAAADFITPTVSARVKQAFVEACLAADPVRADWREMKQWRALDPAKVAVPVMLIHGEHDPYAVEASHAWFMQAVKHGDKRWVVVPRGDHAAHLENVRGIFLRALVGWIRRDDGLDAR